MRTSIKVIAACALTALALAACGGSSGGSSGSGNAPPASIPSSATTSSAATSATAAPAGATTITISNFAFGPASLTVRPGATITVINTDSARHDVDSDDTTSFNTTPVSSDTFTFTAPMTPGSYGYHCSVHPSMKGTLIVA
jgi:plastocyanin